MSYRKIAVSASNVLPTVTTTTTIDHQTTTSKYPTATTTTTNASSASSDGDDNAVNLFWLEKSQICVDFLQAYGVLWLIAIHWPWPRDWLSWSRFGLVALLDFPTLAHFDGGSYPGVLHLILLVYLPSILLATLWYIRTYHHNTQHPLVQWLQRRRVRINVLVLAAAELLYLPAAIAVYRVLLCSTTNNSNQNVVIELDRSMKCWSSAHLSLLLFTLPPLLVFVGALPYVLWTRCSALAVFNESALHEKYLRSREIEQLMRLNTMHSDEHFFIMSSYRRAFVQSKAAHAVYKFTLVTVLYTLGPHVWSVRQAQALVYCLLVTFVLAVRIVAPSQYRVTTSNTQATILATTLSVLSVVGIFSSTGEQSAFLVDDTLRVILAIIFIVGVVIWLGHMIIIVSVRDRHEWPVTHRDVEEMWASDHDMIQSILQARSMLDNLVDCPLEFAPKHEIYNILKVLERMRTKAQKQHVALEWTLQDTLEDIADAYDNVKHHSLLPNPALERLMVGVDASMTRKHYDMMLMNPAKRNMLTRLRVLGQLLGDAYVASVDKSAYMEMKPGGAEESDADQRRHQRRHLRRQSGADGYMSADDYSDNAAGDDSDETSYSSINSLV